LFELEELILDMRINDKLTNEKQKDIGFGEFIYLGGRFACANFYDFSEEFFIRKETYRDECYNYYLLNKEELEKLLCYLLIDKKNNNKEYMFDEYDNYIMQKNKGKIFDILQKAYNKDNKEYEHIINYFDKIKKLLQNKDIKFIYVSESY